MYVSVLVLLIAAIIHSFLLRLFLRYCLFVKLWLLHDLFKSSMSILCACGYFRVRVLSGFLNRVTFP